MAQIETLGFRLIDQSGWLDGKFAPRRYFLAAGDTIVGGPFTSSREALEAAKGLAAGQPKVEEAASRPQ